MDILEILDHDLLEAETSADKIINGAFPEIVKLATAANGAMPVILADLNDPIIKGIAAEIPDGTAVLAGVTGILNRFAPVVAKAADAGVMQGLQRQAIAEVASLIHGAKKTLSYYVIAFEKLIGIAE